MKKAEVIGKGLAASPGAACGQVVFTAEDAKHAVESGAMKKVILVRLETSPEDIEGMVVAQGILTVRGGMTSHAAVVARGMGTCCVSGCGEINVDYDKKQFTLGGKTYHEGDWISLDGSTGCIYGEAIPTTDATISGDFGRFMGWADAARQLLVMTNADNPRDAQQAVSVGGEDKTMQLVTGSFAQRGGPDFSLYLDTSGEGLYKRGYRAKNMGAPLRETLAAALVTLSRYRGKDPFCDPFCGSGTIPIEAALIAHNMSPGIFRKEFAFEKWPDFDQDLFDAIYNDDSQEREFHHHIYGYDVDMKAVNTARLNVRAAGLTKDITVEQRDFKDFEKPADKSIIVTNPPYGERMMEQRAAQQLMRAFGRHLRYADGWSKYIISSEAEFEHWFGAPATKKRKLYNGRLQCNVYMYYGR